MVIRGFTSLLLHSDCDWAGSLWHSSGLAADCYRKNVLCITHLWLYIFENKFKVNKKYTQIYYQLYNKNSLGM